MKPREFVVRLPRPLRDVIRSSREEVRVPTPTSINLPEPLEQPPLALYQLPPENVFETEIGQQLQADRELIEQTLKAITRSIEEIRKDNQKRVQEWQQAAIELGLTIATRVVHQQITRNEFPVEQMVQDMVGQFEQQFIDDVPIRIRLNPKDRDLLEERLQGEPLFPANTGLIPEVIADANMERGCCRVEGKEQSLLSEISEQITQIRDELMGGLGHVGS